MTLTNEQIDIALSTIKDLYSGCENLGTYKTILTALEMAKGNEWQPIETAPKDGTHIYLYDENLTPIEDKHITTGFWDEYRWSQWDSEDYTPTHWKPLDTPTPPKENKEESE